MTTEREFIDRVTPLIEAEMWCPPMYATDIVPRGTQVTVRVLRRLGGEDLYTMNRWRGLIQATCESLFGVEA